MASATKITLSDKELSMVMDASWILTKQAIIGKVYELFALCIPKIDSLVLHGAVSLPAEVMASVPKIYKGENYLQLPYVMLDHPRCFQGAHSFAVRTMFWWGNFFSITLHLSGDHLSSVRERLEKNKSLLEDGFYIGINEDPWAHHFMEDNYKLYQQLDNKEQERLLKHSFVKLALKFELQRWNEMEDLLTVGYRRIAGLLA